MWFNTLTRMDRKLEHSFASASTEDADSDFSVLNYSSSSSSMTDSSDAFCSSDEINSSDDSWFMEIHQKTHFYMPQPTTNITHGFEQMEEDILRLVHRLRIEPNFWTSLSAEERQKYK